MRQPPIKRIRDAFVAAEPPGIRSFLKTYFRTLERSSKRDRNSPYPWTRLPSWRVLPLVLERRYRRGSPRGRVPEGFLADVLWGQYCLYLFIRFQDDLFDGQSHSPVAVYAADQCLFEAERIFSRHIPGRSWFWEVYRRSLRVTTQSIVEVDRLQQNTNTRPEHLLDGYARTGEILKVGSAAVCAVMSPKRAFRAVSLFSDEMAKAGQIMDDLQDLGEDLGRGRYNYVAAVIRTLQGEGRHDVTQGEAFLDALLYLSARERAFVQARRHLSLASDVIQGLGLPGMKKYIAEYGKALAIAESHRTGVRVAQGL
jgi:hypothetical protein